jgi:cytochrome oxidase Cu insertion factor (SCO1/SenC/PrrC family)
VAQGTVANAALGQQREVRQRQNQPHQASEQTMHPLPREQPLELSERDTSMHGLRFGYRQIALIRFAPLCARQRRKDARHRTPFSDREAALGESRDAAHDHSEHHRAGAHMEPAPHAAIPIAGQGGPLPPSSSTNARRSGANVTTITWRGPKVSVESSSTCAGIAARDAGYAGVGRRLPACVHALLFHELEAVELPVEDRVVRSHSSSARPSPAFAALLLVFVITAAWWALALWPTDAAEPAWLSRTRAACFGSAPGGLPDPGGWVLLIGEPIGMFAVLVVAWGQTLRRDLERVRAVRQWWLAAIGVAVATLVVVASLGVRAVRASARGQPTAIGGPGVATRLDLSPPATALVDQHGARVSLADLRGRPALLTVAFGHCVTVCPTVVNDLRRARRTAGRSDVQLVVVTLDPWRDTPDRLSSLAAHWALGAGDRVLSGSVANVEQVLDALGIGRRRNETTGDIEHGDTVMLVSSRGRVEWRIDGGRDRLGELLRQVR